MEASNRLFLDLLESPLHDRELKQASPAKWLTECEQALQQAGELLDPSSSSGLVIYRLLMVFCNLQFETIMRLAATKILGYS